MRSVIRFKLNPGHILTADMKEHVVLSLAHGLVVDGK